MDRILPSEAENSMQGISTLIQEILARRHEKLPHIQQTIEQWKAVERSLVELEVALSEGIAPKEPEEEPGHRNRILVEKGLQAKIGGVLQGLRLVEQRFSRTTLNLGVSGQARVGKSTLLQSISGLTEEQVPTGDNLPVTAVRSRIAHSTSHTRATLKLHDFSSFRREILDRYHKTLLLGPSPTSIESFQKFHYPQNREELPTGPDIERRSTLLQRLLSMQSSLPSYRELLRGGELILHQVDQLRPYIAYPTHADEVNRPWARPYLAVREALIECPFPLAQVERLVLVDLPGLGEVAAEAEEHHVEGLQHEADLVLFVKRPITGMGFWSEQDSRALALLERARGAISKPGQFVVFVVNSDQHDEATNALITDIHRKINEGKQDQHYRVLVCNARDKQDVFLSMLSPVLRQLAKDLPIMDGELLDEAIHRSQHAAREILATLEDISVLREKENTGSLDEDLVARADDLRKILAKELDELVGKLHEQARNEKVEETAFIEATELACKELEDWVADGFGKGVKHWKQDALRTLKRDRGSGRLVLDEMNRIRVEISKRFSRLDVCLRARTDDLLDTVADLLRSHTGNLITQGPGRDALERLAGSLSDADPPCPTIQEALRDLLNLRVDYRTHIHPQVRRAIDSLQPQQRDPKTGELRPTINEVECSEKGVDQLAKHLQQLAEQAIFECRQVTIAHASLLTSLFHTAAEQFDDTFLRSGDSERDFRRLARTFRDDIWPGVYQAIETRTRQRARIARTLKDVQKSLRMLEENR